MPVLYGDHEHLTADAVCIACGSTDALVTDHCHIHGWARGVLCRNCNFDMHHVDRRRRPGNGASPRSTTWDMLVEHAARCTDCPPLEVTDLEPRVVTDLQPLVVKVTDAEKAIVDRLARRDGIIHLDGRPNRSAWVRRMIHRADEETQDES